jgi:hypothetical protein
MSGVTSAIITLVVVGIVGLIIFATRHAAKISAQNVGLVADALGLTVTGGGSGILITEARAEGTYRGKRVEVYSFSTGSGKSRQLWAAISAAPKADGGLNFAFRRQGFGTRVMEMFGAREIQLGDLDFDRLWFVQTNQPDFLRAALLPEIRARISAFAEKGVRGPQIEVESGAVRYAEIGSFSSGRLAERVARAADVVCDLADIMEVFATEDRRTADERKR